MAHHAAFWLTHLCSIKPANNSPIKSAFMQTHRGAILTAVISTEQSAFVSTFRMSNISTLNTANIPTIFAAVLSADLPAIIKTKRSTIDAAISCSEYTTHSSAN